MSAQGWLSYAASINFHGGRILADMALEKRLSHLRNKGWRSDHHAIDGDELIDIWKKW